MILEFHFLIKLSFGSFKFIFCYCVKYMLLIVLLNLKNDPFLIMKGLFDFW